MRFSIRLNLNPASPDAASSRPRHGRSPRANLPLNRGLIFGLLGFLVVNIFGHVLIATEIKGMNQFVGRYLALPLLVLCYGVAWFGLRAWRKTASALALVGWPGLIALLLIFTCSGSVNFANALLADGSIARFSGPIRKLDYTSGKGGRSYFVVIHDIGANQDREFHIASSEYRRLKVGQTYERTMKSGGLGYAYEWR